jgi:hypothetical protein
MQKEFQKQQESFIDGTSVMITMTLHSIISSQSVVAQRLAGY